MGGKLDAGIANSTSMELFKIEKFGFVMFVYPNRKCWKLFALDFIYFLLKLD